MNIILLFFALPVATIILSITLQKILRCAFLTAATFFAIYLILAFTAFDTDFLVFAIAYTIISYITAIIAEFFFEKAERDNSQNNCNCTNVTNNTPDTIAVNVRDSNNPSNNSRWCCYRR